MQTRQLLGVPLLAIALLLSGAGCGGKKVSRTDAPADTTARTEAPADQPASLTVANQTIVDGAVSIPTVVLPVEGWVAVHADNGGIPGAIIGQTALSAGSYTDTKVTIDATKATPVLHAMLHIDQGAPGIFEFPGADIPLSYQGTGVVGSFEAAATPTETEAVKADETAPAAAEPSAPEVKAFTMTAKQWAFEPATITVNKGDKVRLTVKSLDVDHGLSLPAFGVKATLKAGETATVEFNADKTGSFPFVCDVSCGSGHSDMRGTVVVK
ncbi:MAG: hypothetical protein UY92_C0001G0009 [Candidatus Magasanikbacteria bacterium GW2011_GWA2_56_11]|uniref:Cytochrome oxidase subunit II copper A binding domain-containing protein n=1 Tax=Candidatus Magasanikbacteria bacterium GW2011_GWA2_56_11 TaxID=1619044 RepID=A0A0G1YIF2_9BACT|nr:MAG: hypothetical protein UY92_C0001G0009 [Candidatus Magasanikbacteria bacterium GW2011_GWA2_56_11]